MKPIEGPVNKVGGMIDQVTDEVTNMVDSAEKTTLSKIGNGAKLMQAMGIGGQGSAGASGRGEFFETIKSGVHNNLMTLGLTNLKKLGTQVLQAGAAKIKTIIGNALTPKVKFKLGNEEHELWVEKGEKKNVVMMASLKGTEIEENPDASRILAKDGELRNKVAKTENKQNESQATKNLQAVKLGLEAAGKREVPAKDDKPRISEFIIKFKRNPKHDATEFERQLKGQEKGLNSLTVYEFLHNRDRYINEGRAPEGNKAQQAARDRAKAEKITELRKIAKEQGKTLSYDEAEKQASEWLKGQAALHNPDQIAGGNPTDITGMGDARINSSIGSQWKNHIDKFDSHVRDESKRMTNADMQSTWINVKLIY